jgi:hypothetical protein
MNSDEAGGFDRFVAGYDRLGAGMQQRDGAPCGENLVSPTL